MYEVFLSEIDRQQTRQIFNVQPQPQGSSVGLGHMLNVRRTIDAEHFESEIRRWVACAQVGWPGTRLGLLLGPRDIEDRGLKWAS